MVGSREGVFHFQAHFAPGHAKCAFGNDVNRMGLESLKPLLDLAFREKGELDFGVGWQRHRIEALTGMDNIKLMSLGFELGNYPLHCAHHAIDLRFPGVSDDHDAHNGSFALIDDFRVLRTAKLA